MRKLLKKEIREKTLSQSYSGCKKKKKKLINFSVNNFVLEGKFDVGGFSL
jgi:hypothetical protein